MSSVSVPSVSIQHAFSEAIPPKPSIPTTGQTIAGPRHTNLVATHSQQWSAQPSIRKPSGSSSSLLHTKSPTLKIDTSVAANSATYSPSAGKCTPFTNDSFIENAVWNYDWDRPTGKSSATSMRSSSAVRLLQVHLANLLALPSDSMKMVKDMTDKSNKCKSSSHMDFESKHDDHGSTPVESPQPDSSEDSTSPSTRTHSGRLDTPAYTVEPITRWKGKAIARGSSVVKPYHRRMDAISVPAGSSVFDEQLQAESGSTTDPLETSVEAVPRESTTITTTQPKTSKTTTLVPTESSSAGRARQVAINRAALSLSETGSLTISTDQVLLDDAALGIADMIGLPTGHTLAAYARLELSRFRTYRYQGRRRSFGGFSEGFD